jgi:uncharacterized coiled-coil protein SlyX
MKTNIEGLEKAIIDLAAISTRQSNTVSELARILEEHSRLIQNLAERVGQLEHLNSEKEFSRL